MLINEKEQQVKVVIEHMLEGETVAITTDGCMVFGSLRLILNVKNATDRISLVL